MSIEQKINYQLNKSPRLKKVIKRIYQRTMYAISPKIKSEGKIARISPDDTSHEYFFGYYDLPATDKNGENHIATYKDAFRLGSNVAAFLIAETYRNGWNGLGESVENAWKWYVKGAERNQVDCLEAMHDMCYITHDIDLPIEKVDIIALLGARMGSPKLLRAAVAAYSEGRLTKYAVEMEQFHIPTFDGDEAEEEFPDDDGHFDAYV